MRLVASLAVVLLAGTAAERVGFDVLASFDYHEGMTLPAEVTKLDGQTVTIAAFMRKEEDIGAYGSDRVESFVLVNDACGCEGTPELNELVFCSMPVGEKTELKEGIVEVTGTLHVGEVEDGGCVVALYTLDVDHVDAL